jgi:hypothetical protein
MNDAEFRFFKTGNKYKIWPHLGFPRKPGWVGASRVVFENTTTDTLVFEDTHGALHGSYPGKAHQVAPQTTETFNISTGVTPGNSYAFTVTSPTVVEQERATLAYFAANPEIIITG